MSHACSLRRHGRHFRVLALGIDVAGIEPRRTIDWRGSRRPTSSSADAIHGHHRQERTTASAVGRPGDRSYEQTDRPRPSRSRSGPGGQHGRDRPDWRRVVHRPADMKKVHPSREPDPSRWRAAGRSSTQATGSGPGYRRYWRHWRRSPKGGRQRACFTARKPNGGVVDISCPTSSFCENGQRRSNRTVAATLGPSSQICLVRQDR